MTSPVLRVKGRYPVVPGGPAIAPSVSMVASCLSLGDALVYGATKVCANAAVYRPDDWHHLSDTAAYHWLRNLHRTEWNAKAALGTAVHSLAENWASGLPIIDCPPELTPYIDALERFYVDHQPVWLHCERSVVYTEPGREYGGTGDGWGLVKDGRVGLFDWKTGQRYPVEVILKMAAYRYATALAVVEDGVFVDTEPIPEVDFAAAVYLHSDGTYEMLELPADRDAHAAFLALRDVWAWKQTAEAWEKATPEPSREVAV